MMVIEWWIDYWYESEEVVSLLAGLEHVREVLAVVEVIVSGQTVAEAVHLTLAWVHLLLLVLLGSLLLLGLFLGVAARSTHQTAHGLVSNFRTSAEGHTRHDGASDA